MGPRRTAMLLMLAASQAYAQPATSPASGKRIFLPPPLRWDNELVSFRPALQQTATDFANLTDGIAFGMPPAALAARLPAPHPAIAWNTLTLANEYPGEVRYFAMPIGSAGALRMGLTGCTGTGSNVVFLFDINGLVRLSYRLIADKTCPDTNEAAQQIFARYVPLGPNVAFSVRYRTGTAQVVDITDPTSRYVVPIRWNKGGN